MNYFNNLYTLVEIAINHGFEGDDLKRLQYLVNKKDNARICEEYPVLKKFIPYCKYYNTYEGNILAMPVYTYDIYKDTGLLPDLNNYDYEPDTNKLEHWMYLNPLSIEINPETDFEFAEKYFPNCNIWNLFLSGSARIDYYQDQKISLEQRIKFAIVEYMLRRQQFYTTDDFYENETLLKKYRKKE